MRQDLLTMTYMFSNKIHTCCVIASHPRSRQHEWLPFHSLFQIVVLVQPMAGCYTTGYWLYPTGVITETRQDTMLLDTSAAQAVHTSLAPMCWLALCITAHHIALHNMHCDFGSTVCYSQAFWCKALADTAQDLRHRYFHNLLLCWHSRVPPTIAAHAFEHVWGRYEQQCIHHSGHQRNCLCA